MGKERPDVWSKLFAHKLRSISTSSLPLSQHVQNPLLLFVEPQFNPPSTSPYVYIQTVAFVVITSITIPIIILRIYRFQLCQSPDLSFPLVLVRSLLFAPELSLDLIAHPNS
jgi:hypothetical protein